MQRLEWHWPELTAIARGGRVVVRVDWMLAHAKTRLRQEQIEIYRIRFFCIYPVCTYGNELTLGLMIRLQVEMDLAKRRQTGREKFGGKASKGKGLT